MASYELEHGDVGERSRAPELTILAAEQANSGMADARGDANGMHD
jgi:hypothetical protein